MSTGKREASRNPDDMQNPNHVAHGQAAPCQATARQWPGTVLPASSAGKPLGAQWKTAASEEHSKSGAPVPSMYS